MHSASLSNTFVKFHCSPVFGEQRLTSPTTGNSQKTQQSPRFGAEPSRSDLTLKDRVGYLLARKNAERGLEALLTMKLHGLLTFVELVSCASEPDKYPLSPSSAETLTRLGMVQNLQEVKEPDEFGKPVPAGYKCEVTPPVRAVLVKISEDATYLKGYRKRMDALMERYLPES